MAPLQLELFDVNNPEKIIRSLSKAIGDDKGTDILENLFWSSSKGQGESSGMEK